MAGDPNYNQVQVYNGQYGFSNQWNVCHGLDCLCPTCAPPPHYYHGALCGCGQCVGMRMLSQHILQSVTSMARKIQFTCERCGKEQLVKEAADIKSAMVTVRGKSRELCIPCVEACEVWLGEK